MNSEPKARETLRLYGTYKTFDEELGGWISVDEESDIADKELLDKIQEAIAVLAKKKGKRK